MKFCSQCGQGNTDDAEFCVQCGTQLPAEGAAPQAQAAGPGAAPQPQSAPAPGVEQAASAEATPAFGATTPGAAPVAPPGYPAYARPLPTDSMAVVSLVAGIVSFFFCPFIAAILAIIFGYVAKKNIRESNGTLGGDAMALWGIILGFVNLAITLIVVIIIIIAVAVASTSDTWNMITPALFAALAIA